MSQEKLDASGLNPFADFADFQEDRKTEGFESPLAPSVYDATPDPELEKFIEPLLGKDNAKALKYKADSMGVSQLTALRQVMALSFIESKFLVVKLDSKGVPIAPKESDKRTGNDNNPKFQTNIQIRALIRKSNYGFLNATANQLGISNLAAFQAGVAAVLETDDVIKRIQDSELAMEALEKKF